MPAGFLIRFPGYADFEIAADGSRTLCRPCPGLTDGTRDHLFRNQVRPLVLSLNGDLAFHGGANVFGDRCSAFLAASGSGKSTLAAGLAVRGHAFLTDDCLVVEPWAGGGYAVAPSDPGVRLYEDSRDAIVPAGAEVSGRTSYSDKERVLASGAMPYRGEPHPLGAAYVLGPGETDDIVIEPIRGGDRVAEWVAHSFLLDINDKAVLLGHFDKIAALARVVPFFRLDYPRRYSIFDRLARVLADHSRELDTPDATE